MTNPFENVPSEDILSELRNRGFNLPQHLDTKDMVAELLTRKLRRDDGMVDPHIWPLRTALGAIACVDGVAVMVKDGFLHGGVIRRKTGRFPNKLALVGGVVGYCESIGDALKRHYKTDLGVDIDLPFGWDNPVCMRQYAPREDGANLWEFCHDPGKHSYASTHSVVIRTALSQVSFGATEYGGQEAMGLEWYSIDTAPDHGEWSYDMRHTFIRVLEAARSLDL